MAEQTPPVVGYDQIERAKVRATCRSGSGVACGVQLPEQSAV